MLEKRSQSEKMERGGEKRTRFRVLEKEPSSELKREQGQSGGKYEQR